MFEVRENGDEFKSAGINVGALLPSREKVSARPTDEGAHDASGKPARRPRSPRAVWAQAKRLRQEPTSSEQRLWGMLRGRAVGDLKFRRQAPIGPYIVDFVCLFPRLIIEIDGGIHNSPVYDQVRSERREAWLLSQGFRILRLKSQQVEERADDNRDFILRLAGKA